MSTSTVTIDTNEWKYPDKTGVLHTVTNAETFTWTLTDDAVTADAAEYCLDTAQTVATDDGYIITMRPDSLPRLILNYTDAAEGTAVRAKIGDFAMSISTDNTVQIWKCTSLNVDDADAPTTITASFEDQFGNTFSWDAVDISTA